MLILRKPWNSQPADFSELVTDGTIPRPSILWTGGLPGIDRASNLAVVTGAAVTRIIGTQGTAVRTAASATGFVTLGAAADVSPTGEFTVACLFKQDASINVFGFSTRNAAASATHGFELLTGIGGVAGRLTARAGAGTLRTSADASGLNDGKYHIALLGRNADNTMWFWVDGVAIDGFSGTVVGTITSTQSLSLARRGTLYADNEFALTAYWGGVSFSVAQRKAFSDAPWDELFAPQVIQIPVSAGGATPVSSDSSAAYSVVGSAQSSTSAAYAVTGSVQASSSATYSVLTSAQQDAAAAYNVIGRVAADRAASYSVIWSVQSDTSAAYDVLTDSAVISSSTASYSVVGTVASDRAASYGVMASVQADRFASYSINGQASPATFTVDSRSRIGGTTAIATPTRLGASAASDPSKRLGDSAAIATPTRLGASAASNPSKRLGASAAIATPKRLGSSQV